MPYSCRLVSPVWSSLGLGPKQDNIIFVWSLRGNGLEARRWISASDEGASAFPVSTLALSANLAPNKKEPDGYWKTILFLKRPPVRFQAHWCVPSLLQGSVSHGRWELGRA